MLRSADLQLLGASALAAGTVTALVHALRRPGEVGSAEVVAAVAAAVVVDRTLIGDLPSPLVEGGATLGAGAVALLAGWGATRVLPPAGAPFGLAIPLVGAALAGVWAGLPETSGALVAGGILVGLVAVTLLTGARLTVGSTFAVGALPAMAVAVGAMDDPQALSGGLLGSTLLVLLAAVPPFTPPNRTVVWAVATLLQLLSALAAARLLGVAADWGTLPFALAVTVATAAAAVYLLRPRSSGAEA